MADDTFVEPGEEDRPLTIDELRAILRREQQDKSMIRWLAGTLIVVMILFGGVTGYLVNAVNHDRAISDRSDCAREYASLLSKKTNTAVFDGLEQNSQLAQALFSSVTNGNKPGTNPDAVAAFGIITEQLKDALDVAAGRNGHPKLPTPDQAVDHGMTLDGHHYPACPKV